MKWTFFSFLRWIERRLIEPFNCTVFYERHLTPGHPICDPDVIVRTYASFNDMSMNGTQVRYFASET
jgi:hypothetical protein